MYYIGYDIGSSSIKIALLNAKKNKEVAVINEPKGEMKIEAIRTNWAEQSPDLWWEYLCSGTKRILFENKINSSQILGVGISYQMHGLVLLDKNKKVLRNAIIWCDSRAVEIGNKAAEEIGKKKYGQNLLNSPGNFTASKLGWVIDNEPEIYNKAYKLMLPGDFLVAKLTGEFQTTITGLSEGIFWDFKNDTPSDRLFDFYHIDKSLIPEIVPNFIEQARVSKKGSKETGLPEGVPVTYRAGDQPNNAYALGARNTGDVVATAGTSGVVYALTDQLSGNELSKVNTFAHSNYNLHTKTFGKLLNLNGAGIQYRWLHQLTGSMGYEKLNKMANLAPIGSNGLSVFPFGNGSERMLDNKIVNGHVRNINFNIHDNNHMVRATLEGIAFALIYGIEILKGDGVVIESLKVGTDNLFLSNEFSKTISDTLGITIEMLEANGAEGAAKASILGLNDKAIEEKIKITKIISPNADNNEISVQAYENWKNQLINNII